ncbi:MAG TPA: hypothetical protein EYH11_00485 [Sulfurimonas autotrophica]|nr:hypothetical protein [Sulfurimonas autotrophica]
MKKNELLYIEDANKQKLFYYFTPAAFMSNFVPLAVVFTNDDAQALNFEYKMWNILTPVYDFNNQDANSKLLLQNLIKQIAQEHECEEHIYFCDTIGKKETTLLIQEYMPNDLEVYLQICPLAQTDQVATVKKCLDKLARMDFNAT